MPIRVRQIGLDSCGNPGGGGGGCGCGCCGGGGIPGGPDTAIQFNDNGAFNGEANFAYDKVNNRVHLTGSFSQGDGTVASGQNSHAEGNTTEASTDYAHAEGEQTLASGYASHAEGYSTAASDNYSHAEGCLTTASGIASHAEGLTATASGDYSHAEGEENTASGIASHAEGYQTIASNDYSHAEGDNTTASGYTSHAEGDNTTASGDHSHAEGTLSVASGNHSHAEGAGTQSVKQGSHTEGFGTISYGEYSHAEGIYSIASGTFSHAEGQYTIASGSAQTVCGKYNVRGNDFSLFVVGNGTGDLNANRKDVLRVNSGVANIGRVEVTGSLVVTKYYAGDSETLSDPAAVDAKLHLTMFNNGTPSTEDQFTLADGDNVGQLKYFVNLAGGLSGASSKLTPTTTLGTWTYIVFNAQNQTATLIWTPQGWAILSVYGASVT